jgi:hypothetical protein
MPLQLSRPKRAPNTPLPGIDHERPASYTCVFFGATREYGPNEGWQIVKNKKTAKNARRAARRRAEEARYITDETNFVGKPADESTEDAEY